MEQIVVGDGGIWSYMFWGGLSGMVGYLYAVFTRAIRRGRNEAGCSLWFMHFSGMLLTGLVGLLFAVMVDKHIGFSILCGLTAFWIYNGLVNRVRNGKIGSAILRFSAGEILRLLEEEKERDRRS